MENGAEIVSLFRDGDDPIKVLEKKRLPILKILDPNDLAVTVKEKSQHTAKEKATKTSMNERSIYSQNNNGKLSIRSTEQ